MKQLSLWEVFQASKKETDPHSDWSPWFRVKTEHLVDRSSYRGGLADKLELLPEIKEWIKERNDNNSVEIQKSWGMLIRFRDDGILAEYTLRWGVQRVYLT
jgi:hypothetical protein